MTIVMPRIDAPEHAYNSDQIPSHYGYGGKPAKKRGGSGDIFQKLLDKLPMGLRDAFFANLHLINRVWQPSRPGGEPIATQPGSWSFAVVGDYGEPTPSQKKVADNIARSGARLIVTVGDNDQNDGREEDFQRSWDPVYGALMKKIPIYPSVGNHDGISAEGLTPYFKRFPHLGGARYYSHVQGEVHFIAIDTNSSLLPGSDQLRWLEQTLAKSTSKHRVVYMHHPLITQMDSSISTRMHDLAPILRRYGVKLALVGHEHYYERSSLAGITQVVVGNGGSTLLPFAWFQAPWSAYRDGRYGHLEIEVQSGRLVGRMRTRDGKIVDTFEVPPANGARQARQGAALLA